MKKISLVFSLALLSILPTVSFGAIMLPKSISIGDNPVHEAGKTVQMNFVDSEFPINRKNNIEYGVARTVKNGEFTSFEILSTETKSLEGSKTINPLGLVIPNLEEAKASSSYVAYIKFYENDNPENESFYFTKEFNIKVNNTPFIQVKNINLLQSNGNRFSTQHGPTIYSPEDAAKASKEKLATSTSIEVTFVSNQDTVVTPSVSFSKIRSDVFTEQFVGQPITIKKGTTYAVIPLPNFDYVPGVYMGKLTFGNPLAKNNVDLQYIVAGDSVSVGTVSVTQQDNLSYFTFDIFGTPLDLDRATNSTASTTEDMNMYEVTTEFINANGKIIHTVTQEVDFNGLKYSVEIPKKFASVEDVRVTVVSPSSNEAVYEATKNVEYVNKSAIRMSMVLYVLLYILFIIGLIISIFKGKIKTAVVCLVLLVGLFFARQVFALYEIETYSTESKQTYFNNEKTGAVPKMLLQDDIVNTTYSCGQSIQFTFKILYLRCSNTGAIIDVGISRLSHVDAYAKRVRLGNSLATEQYLANVGKHAFYASVSPFVTRTIEPVAASMSKLYITVDHAVNSEVATGINRYVLPLKNSCDTEKPTCTCSGRTETCTQGSLVVSTTPNAPACSLQASCAASLSGTNASFNVIATNALGAISYKDTDTGLAITNPYTKEGRRGTTVVQKTTITDAFDGMTAALVCSVDISMIPPNEPPTAVCTPGTIGCTDGGTVCIPGTPGCPNNGGGSCTPGTPGCPSGGGSCTPGTPGCLPEIITRKPTIKVFKPTQIVVPKNQNCTYTWAVEDVDRCSLSVNNTSVLLQGKGLTGPIDVSAANGNNQRATLTCVAEDLPKDKGTVSSSTLCQVLPEVIER